MKPQYFLRIEGFSALVAGLVVYFEVGGPLWLFVLLALAPDISMMGYLGGSRIGSLSYNIAHTYVLPLGLAGIGVWTNSATVIQVAAVWVGHIGFDRMLGFGLKYDTGFSDTHLGKQPTPIDRFTEQE